LYFEGRLSGKCPDSVKVGNTMLMDLYEDQKNLVIVTCGGEERGFSFDYHIREVVISLKPQADVIELNQKTSGEEHTPNPSQEGNDSHSTP